jgi:outer membrane receptor for ferrienterochelin and colicins
MKTANPRPASTGATTTPAGTDLHLSAGLFANQRKNNSDSTTEVTDAASDRLLEERETATETASRNMGLNLGGRLQWRLGEGGDALTLMPGMHLSRNRNRYTFDTTETLRRPGITPELADRGSGGNESSFVGPRLMLQYRQRVADWRLEGGGTVRGSRWVNDSTRDERRSDGSVLRTQEDHTVSREKGWQLNAKGSRLLGGEGDNLKASTLRLAAYAQDEWQLNPNWGLHAGLRWEGITTHGDSGQSDRPKNTSSVWTPLLHAVFKPDPKSRDQVRISLTRSYRSPPLGALIARPSINREFPVSPVDQANRETYPDSAGNPDLKPELATGIDVALERYIDGGGVLSANIFHRNISNLIRGSVALEDVVWSSYPRWVRRQRNIGDASTSGIELEAKFRLDQLIDGAPGVELRSNLALYRSRVKSVPGPDNRLDQQAKATANIGADYRLRGLPLTLGGNLNWVPATTTRLDVDQTSSTSTKQVWDLSVVWAVNPALGVRLGASNLDPRDYTTETYNDSDNPLSRLTERTHVVSGGPSFTNWQLRLELKL